MLGSWVRIPLRAWMFVSCLCCVLSCLCDEVTTRQEEPYWVRVCVCVCVCVCMCVGDLETSAVRRPRPKLRGSTIAKISVCYRFDFIKGPYCVKPDARVSHEVLSWHTILHLQLYIFTIYVYYGLKNPTIVVVHEGWKTGCPIFCCRSVVMLRPVHSLP